MLLTLPSFIVPGIAIHPKHLSLWERVVLKRHHAYDPEKDRAAKLDELSAAYARALQAKLNELPGDEEHDEDPLSDDVNKYFAGLETDKKNKHADVYGQQGYSHSGSSRSGGEEEIEPTLATEASEAEKRGVRGETREFTP